MSIAGFIALAVLPTTSIYFVRSSLYFLFVKLAAHAKQLDDQNAWDRAMKEALCDYKEPVPGARERIEKALRIMLTAWIAARMRQAAEKMLSEL
jgi:hypothetical protein